MIVIEVSDERDGEIPETVGIQRMHVNVRRKGSGGTGNLTDGYRGSRPVRHME
jgi:hypothetical protein